MIALSPTLNEFLASCGTIAQIIGIFGMFAAIWLVQVIVYPSFLEIDTERWQEFHHRHCRRMGFIVGPLMCCELFGAITMLSMMPIDGFAIALLITSVSTWLITAVLFVPLHRKLEKSHDESLIRRLIKQNWVRTALWSIAAIIWVTRVFITLSSYHATPGAMDVS